MSDAPKKPVLARSLEEAEKGSVVYVDRTGKVRSPARYKAMMTVSYTALVGAVGGATVIWVSMIGLVPGIGIGAVFTGWTAWMLRSNFMLRTGQRLLLAERVDEAIPYYRRVTRSRLTPRVTRALAHQHLGTAYAWKGDHKTALAHLTSARAMFKKGRALKTLQAKLLDYSVINALCALDRAAEARELFEKREAPPDDADYLRVMHWGAELLIGLTDGAVPDVAEQELHRRSIVALGITTAAPLLGLLAWALHRSGDDDQAWHLLREAYDRDLTLGLTVGMPRLWAWMEAHKDQASGSSDSSELPS